MFLPKGQSCLQRFLTPGNPLDFIGYAIVSAMIGLFSSGNLLGLIFVPAFALIWWFVERLRRKNLEKETAFSIVKQPPHPAKGLILLLSPYDPRIQSLRKAKMTLRQLIDRIIDTPYPTESDFAAINLLGSNLRPQIKAVEYHVQQNCLKDVWLIATEKYEEILETGVKEIQGSEETALILEKFLMWRFRNQSLAIHREGLMVKEYDYTGLWRLGETIFRRSGYKNQVIVADITGGNKMMSVAIAMASIAPGRKMQYMDAQRDWQGNPLPAGEISPVLIDVDPILYAGSEDS